MSFNIILIFGYYDWCRQYKRNFCNVNFENKSTKSESKINSKYSDAFRSFHIRMWKNAISRFHRRSQYNESIRTRKRIRSDYRDTRKFSVQVTAETAEQKRASHPQSRRSREPGKTQQTQRIIPCDRKLRGTRRDVLYNQAARDFGSESARTMGIVAPRGLRIRETRHRRRRQPGETTDCFRRGNRDCGV